MPYKNLLEAPLWILLQQDRSTVAPSLLASPSASYEALSVACKKGFVSYYVKPAVSSHEQAFLFSLSRNVTGFEVLALQRSAPFDYHLLERQILLCSWK